MDDAVEDRAWGKDVGGVVWPVEVKSGTARARVVGTKITFYFLQPKMIRSAVVHVTCEPILF